MSIDDAKIEIKYIFGEAFEFANYVGLLSVSKKRNLQLFHGVEIDNAVEVNLEYEQLYSEKFEDLYGYTFEEIRSLIDHLKPFKESVDIAQKIPLFQEALKKIIDITLQYNLKNRKQKTSISNEEVQFAKIKLLEQENAVNMILALNSGFFTGLYFAEWCLEIFKSNFQILIETALFDETMDEDYAKYPDVAVLKNKKITLVGDIKSYLPFYFDSQNDKLKSALNQIPLSNLKIIHIFDTKYKPNEISLKAFVKRYNFLLRYFKLLYYMNRVYLNGDNEFKKKKLFGIVLFPTKPILLKSRNLQDIQRYQDILLATLPKNVKYTKYDTQSIDIQEKLLNEYGFDIYQELQEGNLYINQDDDKFYFLIKDYEDDDEKEIVLGYKKKYSEAQEPIKSSIESHISGGWGRLTKSEIQNNHFAEFLTTLKRDQKVPLELLIDGSDQGVGKNFTLIGYIQSLLSKKREKSILFACPRKETISTTIYTFIRELKWFEKEELSNLFNLKFSNGKCNHLQLALKIEDHIRRKGSFCYEGLKIQFIKSSHGKQYSVNLNGYIYSYKEHWGLSATQKLNTLISEKKEGIEIIFITSQSIPFYINQFSNTKNRILNLTRFFRRFDIIVFDELTNSNPLVRESFIDLIQNHQFLTKTKVILKNKLIVLDASITSPDLFFATIKSLITDSNEEYVPFSEYVQNYPTNKVLDQFFNQYIHINYIRFQMKHELYYGLASIAWARTEPNLPIGRIFTKIENMIIKLTHIEPEFNHSLESLLKNNEVIFFMDSKNFIDQLADYLEKMKFNYAISTLEQKDKDSYKKANILGTNSLAFGTSFRQKKLMIIIPPYRNTDYFQYKQNIELIRQVTKRMRGLKMEPIRFIIFVTLPCETNNSIYENVQINYYKLQYCINNYLYSRKYHQLPSFSSRFNSKDGNTSIYSLKLPKEKFVPLEKFLKNDLPAIRRILYKWGLKLYTSFEISFDPDKMKYYPIPNHICFCIEHSLFSKFFDIHINPVSDQNDLSKIKKFLDKPFDKISNELQIISNLIKYSKGNTKTKYSPKNLKDILLRIISQLESIKMPSKNQLRKFGEYVKELLDIHQLPLSGTAYLITLDIGITGTAVIKKGIKTRTISRDQSTEYLRKLWELNSPFNSLYFGASQYYETPLMVEFINTSVKTVGFLCHYPNFHCYNPKHPVYQLLKKCLLKEIFRENVIYLPDLLKN